MSEPQDHPIERPSDDVELVMIETPAECAELAQVLADVWGFAESSGVASPDNLRAMVYSGCYVAGARVSGRLVGGGFGWPTHVGDEWRLHSHVIGFLDGYRAIGLGARIKHHQRDFVRAQGLAAVEWTFDPLHAANARFNLAKLGATVVGFHRDFYGDLDDAFSAGLGSDRFVVRWGVDDEPTPLPVCERTSVLRVGAGGEPVVDGSVRDDAGITIVTAALPPAVVEIRRTDTALALRWREAFASTVGAAVAEGAQVLGITADLAYVVDRT